MNETLEKIKARYAAIEREADGFGRLIGVRRLRPSEQVKIMEMTVNRDPETIGYLNICASVCEVDGLPIIFPKNRDELDATVNMLDQEGVSAASTAMVRLRSDLQPNSADTIEEQVKKSPPTPEISA